MIEPEKPAVAKQTPAPAEPEKPVERAASAPPPSACRQALTEEIAIAPSIPDINGPGGCGGEDLVRLEAVVLPDKHRVALKPAAILRCTMASAIADWIRTDMTPLAASLGSVISDLDNFELVRMPRPQPRGRRPVVRARSCQRARRPRPEARRWPVDLAHRPQVPREIRETVLHSVCARFTTVLGPGSDGYHEDHIHLDLMERHNNYKICQWYVWDPLPRIAPLLPAERPDEAPPREVAAKSDAAKPDPAKSDPAKPDAARSDTAAPNAGDTPPPTKKAPAKPALLIDRRSREKRGGYWTELPPPCSAICELYGESPWCGSSTTTMVPILTRLYRSITSSFVMRMQPEEIDAPIYSGWLVP